MDRIQPKQCASSTRVALLTATSICCSPHAILEYGRATDFLQIQALSRAFSIPIHVVQHGPPVVVSHGSAGDSFGGTLTPEQSAAQGDEVIRISYHKRMYGLGEVSESYSAEVEGWRTRLVALQLAEEGCRVVRKHDGSL